MLKSYATDCYAAAAANKRYGAVSPDSDEPNSSSNLNSSMDESSQHSQSLSVNLSVTSNSATPLGSITNKLANTNYLTTSEHSAYSSYGGMYSGYHHSMIPTSSPSSFTSGQYSIGSLADSAAAAAAHWSNGKR